MQSTNAIEVVKYYKAAKPKSTIKDAAFNRIYALDIH
jgi:D-hexose-6-phosphate mutarotase